MKRPKTHYEQEFLLRLSHIDRAGTNLAFSLGLLPPIFPLDSPSFGGLDRKVLHDLDGLAERYSRFQDLLGPAFRTLALIEQEPRSMDSFLSLLSLMEKRGIVPDLEQWAIERELRNTASHGYLSEEEDWIEFYNLLVQQSPRVLDYRDRLFLYAEKVLELKPLRS